MRKGVARPGLENNLQGLSEIRARGRPVESSPRNDVQNRKIFSQTKRVKTRIEHRPQPDFDLLGPLGQLRGSKETAPGRAPLHILGHDPDRVKALRLGSGQTRQGRLGIPLLFVSHSTHDAEFHTSPSTAVTLTHSDLGPSSRKRTLKASPSKIGLKAMRERKTLAMVQTAPGELVARDLPIPEIGHDDALLRIEACGICGSDVQGWKSMRRGVRILGHENLGHIAKIGDRAAARWGVKEGDRVALEEYLPCGVCDVCRSGEYRFCPQTDIGLAGERLWYGSVAASRSPARRKVSASCATSSVRRSRRCAGTFTPIKPLYPAARPAEVST